MLLIHILATISSIVRMVETSMYQMRLTNMSEFVCVYLDDSMVSSRIDTTEVKLNVDLELDICHLNNSNHRSSNETKKVMSIIQLSDQCSLAQQLNMVANITRDEIYYAIIFSGE